jgi:cyclomaltodextrinase
VLDGVFNHVGRGFFPFSDLVENGGASPWRDWFEIHGFPLHAYDGDKPNYETRAGNAALPKLNMENAQVREYVLQVAEHWTKRGIDGWRLDAPAEIKASGFWEELRRRTKAINPEMYLVGEIWTDATEWIASGDRFDGVTNYWLGGLTLTFVGAGRMDLELCKDIDYPKVKGSLDASSYAAFVESLLVRYSAEAMESSLNVDSSHDTPRVLSMLGGDVQAVALAKLLMFTLVGTPCIYYGEEIGMAGGNDPLSRGSFPWNKPEQHDLDLLALYRSLSRLRREHVALRRGGYRCALATGAVYAFVRQSSEERLLIAVNAGDAPVEHGIDEPFHHATLLWGEGALRSRGSGAKPSSLSIPARRGAVWALA